MSVPRFLWKSLVTEVPITQQISASGQSVATGATTDVSRDFNLQLAGFLNPFNLADPPVDEIIAGGHVIYLYLRVGSGATSGNVLAELHVQPFAGASFRRVWLDIYSDTDTGSTGVAAGEAKVARFDKAGAAWAVRIVLRNTGSTDALGIEYAMAVRAY